MLFHDDDDDGDTFDRSLQNWASIQTPGGVGGGHSLMRRMGDLTCKLESVNRATAVAPGNSWGAFVTWFFE